MDWDGIGGGGWGSAPVGFEAALSEEVHLWLVIPDCRVAGEPAASRVAVAGEAFRRAMADATQRAVERLAARYLGRNREAIRIGVEERGRPFVIDGGSLDFNLSHSAEKIVIGFARFRIGVDIEAGRRIHDPLALARRYFAAREANYLAALGGDARHEAFLRMWVCKEAAVKWAGCGIAGELRGTILESASPPYRAIVHRSDRLQLREFRPDAELRGAVAAREIPKRVRFFRYPPGG